jgi:hypothetical protein
VFKILLFMSDVSRCAIIMTVCWALPVLILFSGLMYVYYMLTQGRPWLALFKYSF